MLCTLNASASLRWKGSLQTLPALTFPSHHITQTTATEETFRRETETIPHPKGKATARRALTGRFVSLQYSYTAEKKKTKPFDLAKNQLKSTNSFKPPATARLSGCSVCFYFSRGKRLLPGEGLALPCVSWVNTTQHWLQAEPASCSCSINSSIPGPKKEKRKQRVC